MNYETPSLCKRISHLKCSNVTLHLTVSFSLPKSYFKYHLQGCCPCGTDYAIK